ncbi:hypothetical protein FTW19_17735 [Terriglobus albidus]|uniref:Uncharacterized protein n=2 Tax=Terriglobus albidus TaxID=1592106 RepID=A0A5B9EEW8_9BACT|nr:hypothetical protein FTW19_17735 [Terriglobus albidus]
MYHQSAAAEHTEAVTAALLAGGMGQIQEPYPPLNAEHLRRSNKPDGQPAASPAQGTPSAPLAGTSAAHDTVGEIPATREAGPVTVVRAAAIGAPAALARVERSEGDAQHAKESSPQRGESSALTSSAATAHDASNTATKALEAFHGLDLDELAEQVLHRFARTMELEAERRGVSAWE